MGLVNFDLYGIPLNAFDVRALNPDEIYKLQAANAVAAQQAVRDPLQEAKYLANLVQYQPPRRPLDERFEDFKKRLAIALDRHGLTASQSA